MGEAVNKFALERNKKPHYVFCPLGYTEWHKVLEPEAGPLINESNYAIHLWNEMWRVTSQDKNARYHQDCLYEQLKRKYLHINVLTRADV